MVAQPGRLRGRQGAASPSMSSLHTEMDRWLLSVAGINFAVIRYLGDLRALYIICFVLEREMCLWAISIMFW
jgi:hypothetical protein